jgi:hypothetical protein
MSAAHLPLSASIAESLRVAVARRHNILISGGTGSPDVRRELSRVEDVVPGAKQ